MKLVPAQTKDDRIINVLDSACDACPIERFVIMKVCRGCLGHKCQEVCPRNTITIVKHRADINQKISLNVEGYFSREVKWECFRGHGL